MIELEMLAVSWAIAKCRLFLAGLQHFHIVTDHNPLISILNTRRLDEIENPQLQRLKAHIIGYHFTAQWTKGCEHHAPDALSRHPSDVPQREDMIAEHDPQLQPEASISEIRALSCVETALPARLQELRDRAAQDAEYQELLSTILNGFPAHRHQLSETCKRYWTVKEHLSVDDVLIVYGCCLLIPRAMRPQILNDLHESHQGLVRTKQRARLTVYWPGLDNDIDNIITSCQICQDHLPSNHKEPAIFKPRPVRPFQEVAADSARTGVSNSSLPSTAILTGQTSYQWKTTQQHIISLLHYALHSAAQQFLISFGQMADHNLLLKHFTRLLHSGGSHPRRPHQDIPRVMGR